MFNESRYVKGSEVHKYLGISQPMVDKLKKTDPLFPKGTKITNGLRLYDKRELDKWIIAKNEYTESPLITKVGWSHE